MDMIKINKDNGNQHVHDIIICIIDIKQLNHIMIGFWASLYKSGYFSSKVSVVNPLLLILCLQNLGENTELKLNKVDSKLNCAFKLIQIYAMISLRMYTGNRYMQ